MHLLKINKKINNYKYTRKSHAVPSYFTKLKIVAKAVLIIAMLKQSK